MSARPMLRLVSGGERTEGEIRRLLRENNRDYGAAELMKCEAQKIMARCLARSLELLKELHGKGGTGL